MKKLPLCGGLDLWLPEPHECGQSWNQMVAHLREAILRILEIGAPFCSAWKVNTAFFESAGARGYELLERLLTEWKETSPAGEDFWILDAKRADVPHTMEAYIRMALHFRVDAMTTTLCMGWSPVQMLQKHGLYAVPVLLPSSPDFARSFLSETSWMTGFWTLIAREAHENGALSPERTLPVVGATLPSRVVRSLRQLLPRHIFLVPGVGAQGGTLESVLKHHVCAPDRPEYPGVLISLSRSLLYPRGYTFPPRPEDFQDAIHHWSSLLKRTFPAFSHP